MDDLSSSIMKPKKCSSVRQSGKAPIRLKYQSAYIKNILVLFLYSGFKYKDVPTLKSVYCPCTFFQLSICQKGFTDDNSVLFYTVS